jgi:hypothetical protein
LSGCVVARLNETCFEIQSLREDQCSREGMYTNLEGSCLACREGSFLSDPLSTCHSEDESLCCSNHLPSFNASRVCRDPFRYEAGLQLFRRGPGKFATYCPTAPREAASRFQSPSMFDVAKRLGYVTFFGDEFCSKGPPRTEEKKMFPPSPDYELESLYCRLQESQHYNLSALGLQVCSSQRTRSGSATGNPGFDLVHEIWHAEDLAGSPKFVYLNAMAAKDQDLKMIPEYDDKLATFLHSMTSHETFSNTVIVVRSDPMLQGMLQLSKNL